MGQSVRDQIRAAAAKALAASGVPLHNTKLAGQILPLLGLVGQVSAKTLNTCLHDDPQQRFERVGPGLWKLR